MSEMRSECVLSRKKGERFLSRRESAEILTSNLSVFRNEVSRQPNGRAGCSNALPEVRKVKMAISRIWLFKSLRTRCEKRIVMFEDHLNSEPNQSPEPTTTAVTIPAAQEVVPAAVVAHL